MASRQRTAQRASAPAVAAEPVLPELPEAAVVAILQLVPLRDRLSSCALVCRAWAAAAVAATSDVDVQLSRSKQDQQLADWLGKHGAVVQRLGVTPNRTLEQRQRLWLPAWQLVQLRRLDLHNLDIQLAAQGVTAPSSTSSSSRQSQDASGAAALLPQLQELRLSWCSLTEQSLAQLLSATALSKLQLQTVMLFSDSWREELPDDQLLSTLWQRLRRLPHLSELQLHGTRSSAGADAGPVSTLQHLKSLDIEVFTQAAVPDLAALVPAGLTALRVFAVVEPNEPATDILASACITRLSSLASLRVTRMGMAPSCLRGLSGLRELRLYSPFFDNPGSGPRELLGALQHLTQLQHLLLRHCCLHLIQQGGEGGQGGQGGYQCFSALTASSQLTRLALIGYYELPVPWGAVDHMFLEGRMLPHMRELTLTCNGWQRGHCVETAQVARIAASCPALQRLTLDGVTPQDFDRSCLLQLPPGTATILDGYVR